MLDLPQVSWQYHHVGIYQEIVSQSTLNKGIEHLAIHRWHYIWEINVRSQASRLVGEKRNQEQRQRNLTECDIEQTPYKK